MITDLQQEMNRTLTTEQVTMILDFSIQAAEDNGFISSYIFQRAMYVFAAIILYPDRKEEISELIGADNDIRLIWDVLIKDGTAAKMNEEFKNDMIYLGNVGEDWYKEYVAYAHSARGILSVVSDFSGDIVNAAAKKLQETVGSEYGNLMKIADTWGLNRALNTEENSTMHEYLSKLNEGVEPPSENMPNFKLISDNDIEE